MTTYLLIAIIILQLADIITTYRINSRPGGQELNPVLAALFRKVGLLPGLVLIKSLFVSFLWWTTPFLHASLLTLICGMYCWVVWHNLQVLRKQGGAHD
jgi:hypothetical protein